MSESAAAVPTPHKLAWNIGETSEMVGLGPRTIYRKVDEGLFPPPIDKERTGRRNLWDAAAIRAWIAGKWRARGRRKN